MGRGKQPPRDVLGRPIRPDDDPTPPRRKILTDDQITAIAHDVRTRPLAEVGRYVMPLIQHIVETDLRACQSCRFWVAYNQTTVMAHQGECTRPNTGPPMLQLLPIPPNEDTGGVAVAFLTAFDWACKGWEQKERDEGEAQSSHGG